jgi:hypothetical protein
LFREGEGFERLAPLAFSIDQGLAELTRIMSFALLGLARFMVGEKTPPVKLTISFIP